MAGHWRCPSCLTAYPGQGRFEPGPARPEPYWVQVRRWRLVAGLVLGGLFALWKLLFLHR